MPLVRPAATGDARAAAELLAVLGYPASEDEVRERLSRVPSDGACIVVAEEEEVVVGLATGHALDVVYLAAPAAWLTALVVRADLPRQGIGRALVQAIEAWARERGCSQLGVLTGIQRSDAHAFYEALGYARTGHRYAKKLTRAV